MAVTQAQLRNIIDRAKKKQQSTDELIKSSVDNIQTVSVKTTLSKISLSISSLEKNNLSSLKDLYDDISSEPIVPISSNKPKQSKKVSEFDYDKTNKKIKEHTKNIENANKVITLSFDNIQKKTCIVASTLDKWKNKFSSIVPRLSKIQRFLPSLSGLLTAGEVYNKLSSTFDKSSSLIGKFFDNTMGKMMKVFAGGIGEQIYSGIKMVTGIGWKVIEWTAKTAFYIIDASWRTMKWLAKIGWSVVSAVFSTVASWSKNIVSWFFDMFLDVLSTPVVLLGVALLLTQVPTSFWYKIKDSIISVIGSVWNVVADSFEKIYNTSSNFLEKIGFDAERRKTITTSIKGIFAKIFDTKLISEFWDSGPGKMFPSLSSDNIKKVVDIISTFGESTWETMKSFWDIFTDSSMGKALKSFYKTFMAIYRVATNKGATLETEFGKIDTSEDFEFATKNQLNAYAQMFVEEKTIDEYFNNIELYNNDQSMLQTVLYGKSSGALEDFKNKMKSTLSGLSSTDLDNIKINTQEIVTNVMSMSIDEMKKVSTKDKATQQIMLPNLQNLFLKYETVRTGNFDPKSYADVLKNITVNQQVQEKMIDNTFEQFNNTITDSGKTFEDVADELDSFMSVYNNTLNDMSIKRKEFENKYNKSKNKNDLFDNARVPVTNDEIPSVITNDDYLKKLYYGIHGILIEPSVNPRDRDAVKELAEEVTNDYKHAIYLATRLGYTAQQALAMTMPNLYSQSEDVYNSYVDLLNIQKTKKFEYGGVVDSPTYFMIKDQNNIIPAVVGEGHAPELITPLNRDGINFILNAVKEPVAEHIKSQESQSKKVTHVINKYIKSDNIDETMFDMKNLALGLIGV